jgi:hypothetical protein
VALGERGHEQGQARRGEQRAAEPLERAERDQGARRPREPAEGGADDEDEDAEREDAPASEEVCDPPAEQQESAEDDRVRGDDPLEPVLGEAERALQGVQCDVHDRDVEDDHELRDDDESEGAVAPINCGVPK